MTETTAGAAIETTATGHPSAPILAREAGVNPVDYMRSRGFVYDVSDEAGLRELFDRGEPVTLYQGFDPTGPSLHAGHMVGIMMLGSMQRLGHRPIALGGGGTAMVGDPSGRTSTRELIREEDLASNIAAITVQLGRYLDYAGGRFGDNPAAISVNNADWLLDLKYIPFLRDIGRHFSVNEMLGAETYRERLESTGLNFVEFNYRIVQAYDFLHLYRTHGCLLQLGGSDQWGNIVAGVDLVRRVEAEKVFALVCPLITTASGEKMGKTGSGVRVWLDPELFSPYDYFQYWVNTDDALVETYLKQFTFLPNDVIAELTSVRGQALREAKTVLALEATALAHGKEKAFSALGASSSFMNMIVKGIESHLKDGLGHDFGLGVDTTDEGSAPGLSIEEMDVDISRVSSTKVSTEGQNIQPFTRYVMSQLDPTGTNTRLQKLVKNILEPQQRAVDSIRQFIEPQFSDQFWTNLSTQLAGSIEPRELLPRLDYGDLFQNLPAPTAENASEALISDLVEVLDKVKDRDDLLPTTELTGAQVTDEFTIADAFVAAGLAKGRGEARRLAQQGGLRAGEARIDDVDQPFATLLDGDRAVILRAGKKRYQRVVLT